MNTWVYNGFESTYKKIGVSFDKNYYESDYDPCPTPNVHYYPRKPHDNPADIMSKIILI